MRDVATPDEPLTVQLAHGMPHLYWFDGLQLRTLDDYDFTPPPDDMPIERAALAARLRAAADRIDRGDGA
jgi:hypothetical protein